MLFMEVFANSGKTRSIKGESGQKVGLDLNKKTSTSLTGGKNKGRRAKLTTGPKTTFSVPNKNGSKSKTKTLRSMNYVAENGERSKLNDTPIGPKRAKTNKRTKAQ